MVTVAVTCVYKFDMQISRVLHAGYVFDHGGTRILFDPLFENPFSRNCHAYPSVRFDLEAIRRERFDAVFISHYHDDHCSFVSLDLIDRATPIHVYCVHDELFDLIRALGFRDVRPLVLNRTVVVGDVSITAWPALDRDVDSMFEIEAGGRRVLNVVDAWIDDETLIELARKTWDVVLWPFQTMRELAVLAPARAEPAARGVDADVLAQLRALAPRYVVPSSCQFLHESWSWYRTAFFPMSYARFAHDVERACDTRVERMEPGESFTLDEDFRPSHRLGWVMREDDALVDYAYEERAQPPPTAEIARCLPALDEAQLARVDRYCLGLKPSRAWRLLVFDHHGRERRYEFAGEGPVWTTEVPATTLYGALENGESLSSMYVRIDDGGDREADLLEDPLLSALFDGAFGSYQRAQLTRLGRASFYKSRPEISPEATADDAEV